MLRLSFATKIGSEGDGNLSPPQFLVVRPSVDPTSFPARSAIVVVVIDGSISFPASVTDLHDAVLK